MPCTEAYREHIMYTFNGYCKTVIRFAAINAWRDRSRRRQKEISLEYLTEEKFYPLGTTDEYFEAPYEEHPVTICGQTVILTNGELAAPHFPCQFQSDFMALFGRYLVWLEALIAMPSDISACLLVLFLRQNHLL